MAKRYLYLAALMQSVFADSPADFITENQVPSYGLKFRSGEFAVYVGMLFFESPIDDNGMLVGKADFRVSVTIPQTNRSGRPITIDHECNAEEYSLEDGLLVFPAFLSPRSCTTDLIDDLNNLIPGAIHNEQIVLEYNPEDFSLNANIGAPVKIPLKNLIPL